MTTLYDVKSKELIDLASQRLKDKISKPEYMNYVKSGPGKERPPSDENFWYIRGASVLRQIYMNGPIGVSKLTMRYSNRKEHSVSRKHTVRASSGILRDLLQQLEKAELVKTTPKGRILTDKGKSFIDKISSEIAK